MMENPVVTIVHELSGRMRMRLSVAPKSDRRMIRSVKDHLGIEKIQYTPVTKSVLIQFNPEEVTREEILIRIGVYLSLDNESKPVRVYSQPRMREMSDSAFYSGLSLAIALLSRMFRGSTRKISMTEWMAGISTALAVLEHGWGEVKKRGYFDPEVLSVVYLVTALIRGNFLPAALFTWISTFGRHIIKLPPKGVELKPVELKNTKSGKKEYEVEVSNIQEQDNKMVVFNLVPAIWKFAFTGDSAISQKSLINEIQKVSKLHGEVLEGLEKFKEGIPLKVKMV
ncbi:hypothetical protein GF337_14760 [candidate division KSB1 bacterium]|nr:hypothetical protein [candidate division KSB1 bacterium]